MSRRFMTRARRFLTSAVAALGLLCLMGDRQVSAVVPPGIDPLELLDLQVKNNVFIVLDTSASMFWPPESNGPVLGIDDPRSRMYQARQAIKQVVDANKTRVNFGLGTYSQSSIEKPLNQGGFAAPFMYVSNDPNARRFYDSNTSTTALDNFSCVRASGTVNTPDFFCENSNTYTNFDFTGNEPPTAAGTDTNRNKLWRSFRNPAIPFPANCTGSGCRYYLESKFYRDDVQITWDTSDPTDTTGTDGRYVAGPVSYTCPLAPAGLVGPNLADPINDSPAAAARPCIRMCDNAGTDVCADFFLTSAVFQGPDNCGEGAAILNTVAACNADNAPVIQTAMQPAFPFDAAGAPTSTTISTAQPTITGATTLSKNLLFDYTAGGGRFMFPVAGLRDSVGTPLGASLRSLRCAGLGTCPNPSGLPATAGMGTMTPAFPAPPATPVNLAGLQRNFVILLTDGDDQCGWSNTELGNAARELYYNGCASTAGACNVTGNLSSTPTLQAETIVIAFSAGITDRDTANVLARAGSGGNADGTCPSPLNGRPCRDAFFPTNLSELNDALSAALAAAANTGTFSDQQSITESVFEYGPVAVTPAADPMDPATRYDAQIPILLQSTFDMPGFVGHLKAFRNDGTATALELWDAGAKLLSRVTANGLTTAANTPSATQHTFAQLVGNATAANVKGSTALIKRRIYTTSRAGVSSFLDPPNSPADIVGDLIDSPYFQPTEQVPLWPPTAAIDPGTYATLSTLATEGSLDPALGLTAANYPTVGAFEAAFGACTRSTAGSAFLSGINSCTDADGPGTTGWNFARKEARQIVLAWLAGAQIVRDGNGAIRTSGLLRFKARPSILTDSTLAAPAVVTPPIEAKPKDQTGFLQAHDQFVRGPRQGNGTPINAIDRGFGLRNPDVDTNPATEATSEADTALKPLMSVVYHASNAAIHAFRAGPCPGSTPTCRDSSSESGGEELWAFVPYDQLSKLRLLLQPPTRDNHVYMMAAPIRFADVFVPGSFSLTLSGTTVSGSGVWRTVMIFGRGIGGKHLTALDVTVPGPFTENTLDTNPPIHLWTRGNPDTQDLTAGGTKNAAAVSPPAGNSNFNAYALMGETWSVPAIAFVDAASNTTTRRSSGVSFVAYVGSGYSTVSSEGSTFYTLDVMSGDVVASVDVGDRSPAPTIAQNALVASAVAYQAKQLRADDPLTAQVVEAVGHPASDFTEKVFIGDLHGRLWRFLSTSPGTALLFGDLGSNQPVAHPVALLNINNKAHVFVETGHDNRLKTVTDPPPNNIHVFKLFGLRDDNFTSGDTDGGGDGVVGPAKVLFVQNLPDGYRGTVQPAVAFNDATPPQGRVFFAGVKFNPAGSAAASPCLSSFDSVLFALGAETGGAAYDFGTNVVIEDQRVQAVRVDRGRLVLDRGLEAQNPPPPPAPPAPVAQVEAPQANVFVGSAMSAGVPPPFAAGQPIPGVTPFRLGSRTCR